MLQQITGTEIGTEKSETVYDTLLLILLPTLLLNGLLLVGGTTNPWPGSQRNFYADSDF